MTPGRTPLLNVVLCGMAGLVLAAMTPAQPAPPEPTIRIGVQAIQVEDDDGARPARVTPANVTEWIDFANRSFAPAGIEFVFHGDESDYCVLKSTVINDMTGGGEGWAATRAAANEAAARYPDRLVVYFRHGPGPNATGGGFSWTDLNFVGMFGWEDGSHCGHRHTDAVAHEIGHYLGLPHTFAVEPFQNVGQAEAYFVEHGRDPNVFDGDGFADTLPDPGCRPLECDRVEKITLDGVEFVLPRRNLMSYYDERDTLSPEQIARARWMLQLRMGHGMGMPVNRPAREPIEAEKMTVLERRDCAGTVQPMDSFGAGSWSGGAQLFCGAEDDGSITLALPVGKAGPYRIDLYATQAPDFAIIQTFLDDKRLGKPFDAYAPLVIASGRVTLGMVRLEEGQHRLRFDVTGRNAASSAYRFGIDCVEMIGPEHRG
jgi:hypothetical protein